MFDNLGTALVQALGFFAVLVFLYIKLYLQIANPKIQNQILKKQRFPTKNYQLKKSLKKAYLIENQNLLKRILQSKKRVYLGEKKK